MTYFLIGLVGCVLMAVIVWLVYENHRLVVQAQAIEEAKAINGGVALFVPKQQTAGEIVEKKRRQPFKPRMSRSQQVAKAEAKLNTKEIQHQKLVREIEGNYDAS